MTTKSLKLVDIIKLSAQYLSDNKIENPRLNAELIIGHVLQQSRVQLYLNFEKPLNETELENIRSLLRRRAKQEPLQYLTGETEFFSLKFKVNKHVLIPRPETEILVEKIIEICKQQSYVNILDIGTGCGNIAISIAKHRSNTHVKSIDIQPECVKLAKQNALLNDINDRIEFAVIDLFDASIIQELNQKFDIIVTNPPYISKEEYEKLPQEIKNYEPAIALTDEKDGYTYYERILNISEDILNIKGFICMEIGAGMAEKLCKSIKLHHFEDIKIFNDLNNIERIIIAQKSN